MESRKGWRNRDSSAGEGVLALLESLRQGLGAQAVGLFDDDRADPDPSVVRGALNFWDGFEQPPCAEIDWDSWYRDLRQHQRVETTCGCGGGGHHLYGFLIHGRWALLLVAPPALPSGGAVAIASSLRALADKLPPAKSAAEWAAVLKYDGAATAQQNPVGAPLRWVRKPPQ